MRILDDDVGDRINAVCMQVLPYVRRTCNVRVHYTYVHCFMLYIVIYILCVPLSTRQQTSGIDFNCLGVIIRALAFIVFILFFFVCRFSFLALPHFTQSSVVGIFSITFPTRWSERRDKKEQRNHHNKQTKWWSKNWTCWSDRNTKKENTKTKHVQYGYMRDATSQSHWICT